MGSELSARLNHRSEHTAPTQTCKLRRSHGTTVHQVHSMSPAKQKSIVMGLCRTVHCGGGRGKGGGGGGELTQKMRGEKLSLQLHMV